MSLSILTCYVFLMRIFRTIFSSIYTAFTVAKETNMKLPPLFPGLKLGGCESQMNFQVQSLVQMSTNLLNKIDEALGVPDAQGRTKKGGGVLGQTGSAVLLQNMMKEEEVEGLEVTQAKSLYRRYSKSLAFCADLNIFGAYWHSVSTTSIL
jgi:hypothetical protein